MAVPKKRTSSSRRDMRRAHDALRPSFAVICPNCAEPMLRHRVCRACGEYRGKIIVEQKSGSEDSSEHQSSQ